MDTETACKFLILLAMAYTTPVIVEGKKAGRTRQPQW